MKTKIPKGSWLDTDGKRWINIIFDVMTDKGRRFVRQVKVKLGLHFDFSLGEYIIDLFIEDLAEEILRQYPSLASIKEPTFIPTTKIIR